MRNGFAMAGNDDPFTAFYGAYDLWESVFGFGDTDVHTPKYSQIEWPYSTTVGSGEIECFRYGIAVSVQPVRVREACAEDERRVNDPLKPGGWAGFKVPAAQKTVSPPGVVVMGVNGFVACQQWRTAVRFCMSDNDSVERISRPVLAKGDFCNDWERMIANLQADLRV